ncbi:AraC family transcriptional regulator [Grimontia sp. NTOU-MAR1]|uniref:AraC family transcriptional regulator n=1 Tax=Grimontia sp. NTOU-MAR1 TaxID=3111011 RepID=UPI002DBF00C2|nr:AraC family transcriptional regulator [Grimontia sp. NTOU-MAR1]WRW00989.1 AraC family transcriptional regulator [Grimontia sp. NTOU-MAR1]
MKRQSTADHYRKRLSVLSDYIYENLEVDLDMDKLAQVALISPYHLHRIYRGIYGNSLTDSIRWIRLHYAADRLIKTDLSIEVIGRMARYNSVQSFTRVFSETFGMPPARFRREGDHVQFSQPIRKNEDYPMQEITIRESEAMTLIGLEHSGDYMKIGQQFEKLQGWLTTRNLIDENTRFFGVYFDDPDTVPTEELRSLACIKASNADDLPLENGLKRFDIQAGKCAVMHYKGPYANMDAAYRWLFSEWLPNSTERIGNQPAYEEYLNDVRSVPQTELLTDIYIPLE